MRATTPTFKYVAAVFYTWHVGEDVVMSVALRVAQAAVRARRRTSLQAPHPDFTSSLVVPVMALGRWTLLHMCKDSFAHTGEMCSVKTYRYIKCAARRPKQVL